MINILLIDDDPIDCLVFKKMLEQAGKGFKLAVKNNGKEALDYLTSVINNYYDWPDHIFLDINMPYVNGFQFAERFQTFPTVLTSRSKIHLLSSSYHPGDKIKASQFKMIVNYLGKPITKSLLIDILTPKLT